MAETKMIVKDLGEVTAYAYAVSKGYTGTEEEFATLMASYATVGQQAVDAKDAAVIAKNEAEAARDEADAAKETAVKAAEDAAKDAKDTVDQILSDVRDNIEQIDQNTLDISDLKETTEDLEDRKANIDGSYPDMTVGNAEQLNSSKYVENSEPYTLRTSGGTSDIGNREYLDAVVGGTVAWNQMVRDEASENSTDFAPIVTVTDAVEDAAGVKVKINPVQDLHGYENPWPAGGGVNKIDVNQLVSYGKTYGLRTSFDGDWIVLSGEYTSTSQNANFRIAQLIDISVFPVTKFKAFPDSNTSPHMTSAPFGLADGNKTLTIHISGMVQGETYNLRFKIVGYEGDTAPTEWTPYSNICPISGFEGLTVTRTGKNLLDYPYEDIHLNQPDLNHAFVSHCKIPATCTFSFMASSDYANSNNYWLVYVAKGNVRTYITPVAGTTVSKTIVASQDDPITEIYIRSPGITSGNVVNIQLELGSTATAYEPYQGETYTVSFPTEAGTVYGGSLTIAEDGSGVLTVDMAELDLGTLNYGYNATYKVFSAYKGDIKQHGYCVSSQYEYSDE